MTTAPTVFRTRCAGCGGLFRIIYAAAPTLDGPRLPHVPESRRVRLGEGSTPILQFPAIAKSLGLGALWAKLEFMSPTGSFKDRGSAVLVSAAYAEDIREFVEDSSGNAGASLAAYAAAAGMKAHVFVPASASSGKLDQIQVFGAELHAVDGPRQAATDAAQAFVQEHRLAYLSHNLSPYFSEGMKAAAYEIFRPEAAGLQHVVLPVGNGSMLIGMRRGFGELIEAGADIGLPAFHAVQSEAVMPVVAEIRKVAWNPLDAVQTRASGIAVSRPPRLAEMVNAVKESGGTGIAVKENAIAEWQSRLARETGIFCEPTSAAAFAGLQALIAEGAIERGSNVVVPVTGSGLKEPL